MELTNRWICLTKVSYFDMVIRLFVLNKSEYQINWV